MQKKAQIPASHALKARTIAAATDQKLTLSQYVRGLLEHAVTQDNVEAIPLFEDERVSPLDTSLEFRYSEELQAQAADLAARHDLSFAALVRTLIRKDLRHP